MTGGCCCCSGQESDPRRFKRIEQRVVREEIADELGAPECPVCHGTGTDPETDEPCECTSEAET